MTASRTLPRYIGPDTSALGRKMTNEEIRARFDVENAAVYNGRLRRWLPEDRFSGHLMIEALRPYLSSGREPRVLDLGAGAGRSARNILRAFRNCHVTLVDFSQNMLDEVPHALAAYPGRFTTVQADFWNVDFAAGDFDVVIASFALHHGRGETVYGRLYRKVHAWLESPGIFACCDIVEGDSVAFSVMNESGWQAYLRRKGFGQQDIERLFSNYRYEDSPLSLKQHLTLLTEAGFTAADVLWKRFNFAVYVGVKES